MRPRHLLPLLVLLGGCLSFGPGPADHPMAQSPAGSAIQVTVARSGSMLAGELLAVRDSGYVIWTADRIVLVSHEAISRVSVDHLPTRIPAGARPWGETLEALRLASRYPQGLSDELMARLLAQTHQTEIAVVRP